MAYCGYLEGCRTWKLRNFLDNHACSRQFNIKMMNVKWLSETLDNSLHENPNLKINEIRSKALRKWNTNVTISKANREKIIASYKVEVQYTLPTPACRPFIGLDECFLKRKYKGELLTTIGRDPNDQMLPLAYAIMEVKNKDNWTWFLELLIEDLRGAEVYNSCTFMSDQQKGLLPAIYELLPRAEHRFCMRHLYANFRKKFSGQNLKNLMWKDATNTYPQALEREMLNIKEVNQEAYKYLIAISLSVIVDARGKPIITMLEEIKVYLMKRWATNRIKMCNMDFDICPKIRKRLTKESNLSKNWIPSWSAEKLYEVRHFAQITNKFVVNLDNQECSCRKWLIIGIPCCHVTAAMKFLNFDPEDYVPISFKQSTYDETYASIIFPVNDHLLWERKSYPNVLPPLKRILLGRSKKKRRLEQWELRRDETQ
ncbi:uncharacterized protein LOC124827934 [Vigna umbellata]|uniref:uncharacterized protein LOC124827934 n=1 Tax=Vigna umbellata TaxID=87088 RepID=UPI001F5ECB3E|nr:uncharacterized protein LOC124827934 [Vigna umbellata]